VLLRALSVASLCLLSACAAAPPAPTAPDARTCGPVCEELGKLRAAEVRPATPADARAFVEQTSRELKRLQVRAGIADWVKSTYITDDTERLSAELNDEALAVRPASPRCRAWIRRPPASCCSCGSTAPAPPTPTIASSSPP